MSTERPESNRGRQHSRDSMQFPWLKESLDARRFMSCGCRKSRAGVPPHRVRALHREWTRSLDHGPPPNSHALGDDPDLNTLANAAEQLFARDD